MLIDDPSDFELEKPVADTPVIVKRPDRGPWWALGGAVVVLAVALVLGYYILHRPPKAVTPAAAVPAARPGTTRGPEAGEQIPLPPLDETDALVRQLIGRLSSHPTVAAWLATDGLLVNFAVVTQRIADGDNPVQELKVLGPVPAFRTLNARGDRIFIDRSSYSRYDKYAQAVSGLDSRGTARLYATLKPRITDAHRRLGPGAGDFDPVLERAIVQLLQVPVIQGDVELVPKGGVYAFADPRLEAMSGPQKQLLRMGPQNVQAIQAKLREIADYLAIPAARLPPR